MRIPRMLDQVAEFEAQQASRCAHVGIDVSDYPLSHVAISMSHVERVRGETDRAGEDQ
jgi:hypothetical protein